MSAMGQARTSRPACGMPATPTNRHTATAAACPFGAASRLMQRKCILLNYLVRASEQRWRECKTQCLCGPTI
jgi:hypothetical protein